MGGRPLTRQGLLDYMVSRSAARLRLPSLSAFATGKFRERQTANSGSVLKQTISGPAGMNCLPADCKTVSNKFQDCARGGVADAERS